MLPLTLTADIQTIVLIVATVAAGVLALLGVVRGIRRSRPERDGT